MFKLFYFYLIFIFANLSQAEQIVTLNKELNPKTDFVDLPAVQIHTPKKRQHIGYGIYFDSWSTTHYICRIHFNKPEHIKKNTQIVLSGKVEIEKLKSGLYAHKFFVKEPSEIDYICCGAYVDEFRSLLSENPKIISRSFLQELK